MKERPILFSAPMVRALLAGTKTQTRRIVKHRIDGPHPPLGIADWHHPKTGSWIAAHGGHFEFSQTNASRLCPYGLSGDQLWVREAHWWFRDEPDHETGYYPPKLTTDDVEYRADGENPRRIWRPSIHMPRWASRITLEVTGVRVERLQDINADDAVAEGIERDRKPEDRVCLWRNYSTGGTTVMQTYSYHTLWESINGAGSWDANPWVWCVSFRRL